MRAALALATRGLGNVWPNPAVGCLIVRDGLPVGRGWTQPGGRPHAETVALAQAGTQAAGATAYVTLEPCAHHGQTPPCTDALIAARVARAVVAAPDPDPRVNGGGIAALQAAGIAVTTDLMRAEAEAVNAGFLSRVNRQRPLVTLKLATTLDGRIATRTGDSQWITGEDARQRGQLLRAQHDAILVGAGTLRADNPALTCRLPGLGQHSPVRVVLSGRGGIPAGADLINTGGDVPTWLLAPRGKTVPEALRQPGVEIIACDPNADGGIDPAAALTALAGRGITRLLIEGGAAVATSFLAAGLVDHVAWFRAASLIGGDGLPAISGLGIETLPQRLRLERLSIAPAGDDVLETYAVRS